MQRGEIHLASFPFGDMPVMKLRPVLLLTGPVGAATEVVAAYVSSVIPSSSLETDILIDPRQPQYQCTRLKSTSVLRLHKLATIHLTSLQRRLGTISTDTQMEVDAKLREMLRL